MFRHVNGQRQRRHGGNRRSRRAALQSEPESEVKNSHHSLPRRRFSNEPPESAPRLAECCTGKAGPSAPSEFAASDAGGSGSTMATPAKTVRSNSTPPSRSSAGVGGEALPVRRSVRRPCRGDALVPPNEAHSSSTPPSFERAGGAEAARCNCRPDAGTGKHLPHPPVDSPPLPSLQPAAVTTATSGSVISTPAKTARSSSTPPSHSSKAVGGQALPVRRSVRRRSCADNRAPPNKAHSSPTPPLFELEDGADADRGCRRPGEGPGERPATKSGS